ncbi:MAG: hypothetical protein ACXWW7_15125 [Nocardioides sp.]
MSDPTPADRPEPQEDAPPDEGPGGPADMVHRDSDDVPPATPDLPRSAQVEEQQVPDEIEHPEELDEEQKDADPGTEEPA